MTSQLEVVSCDDEGVFWCEHDNTQSGQGYLDVDGEFFTIANFFF